MSECTDSEGIIAPPSTTNPQPPPKKRRLNDDSEDTSEQKQRQQQDEKVELQNSTTKNEARLHCSKDDNGCHDSNDNIPTIDAKKTYPSLNKNTATTTNDDEDAEEATIDAHTFLFRSPATKEEIETITTKLKSQINLAHEVLVKGGHEAFCRMKRKRMQRNVSIADFEKMSVDDFLHSDDEDDMFGDDDDDGRNNIPMDGMDSDDENVEAMKNKEILAMLDDAVVKGNPRRYQVALVELAKKQNTIVNLGTGQGKTLIALLLIKHFAGAYQEGKQTLFLVPSIALAGQHTTTLLANLPYTVATACHNVTRTIGSKEKLSQANILVATHGAAKDLLMHYGDLFSFKRLNLLIVDECHYCSGEHGYSAIMKNFYHSLPIEKRPRVLGLTASPLVNVKVDVDDDKLGQMLDGLEKTMDSSIACLSRIGVAGRDGVITTESGILKREAEERSIHFAGDPSLFPSLPEHENIGLHQSRIKELNQLKLLYEQLGPKLTSIYAATVEREISRNRFENETNEEFQIMKSHLKRISSFCGDLSINDPNGGRTEKLAVLEQLLEDIIESKGAADTVGVVFVDRRITALALYDYFRNRSKGIEDGTWIRVRDTKYNRQPSLKNHLSLEELLAAKERAAGFDISTSRFQDTSSRIADVENSLYFDVLQDTLPQGMNLENIISSNQNHESVVSIMDESGGANERKNDAKNDFKQIRCDMIVRQCTNVFKYMDNARHYLIEDKGDWLHSKKTIKEVLDGLRTKKTNVLVATSVVEEGVDVEACAFVISFDNIKSTKAYIQMKGRARQHSAKFYVFQNVTPGISTPYLNLQGAQAADSRVRQYIETRRKYSVPLVDPEIKWQISNHDEKSIAAEMIALVRGEYRTSYALVDVNSAKSLLNRYAMSIPIVASNRSSRDQLCLHMPQFEENRLLLPSHIPSVSRCVELPEQYMNESKKHKENLLSLIACVRLHRLNLLSERLLPLQRRDMKNKLLGVALTELFASGKAPIQKNPPQPGDSNQVFVYKVSQQGAVFNQHEKALGGYGRSLCLITLSRFSKSIPTFQFTHLDLGHIMCNIEGPKMQIFSHDEWKLCTTFYTALMNTRWRKRTKSAFYRYNNEKVSKGILPPYVVGCMKSDGDIDWERMNTVMKEFSLSLEERKAAVMKSRIDDDLSQPRIWVPIYDPFSAYIAYGPSKLTCASVFPSQLEDVQDYADYFTKCRQFPVERSTRLFVVQRLWYLPRKVYSNSSTKLFQIHKQKMQTILDVPDDILQDGERSPCEGLVAALLPVTACAEERIADSSLYLHLIMLPQILYHLDHIMTAQLFVEHCCNHLPVLGKYCTEISKDSFEDILEALTAKSCILPTCYDRLEWLGDAVLKLIHTDSLVHSKDLRKWVSYLHEGDLTLLRSAMGSNKRLTNATMSAGFDKFILYQPLGRGRWIPIGMELHEIDELGNEILSKFEEVKPGKKTSADIIESILGLVYLRKGFQAAFDVATELGITLPRDTDYQKITKRDRQKNGVVAFVETFLGGLKFRHPELIEEATTHPSCVHEEVPCYQRLEWFGDAVLCMYAREWIYKCCPELDVGELVIIEATVVCNETLAYLCVSNGFQRYLNHRDPLLPKRISDFEAVMEPKERGLWATDPPKALSDMIEAIFGAAHVDSGFEAGQRAVGSVMKPVLNALHDTLTRASTSSAIKERARRMMHPKQYINEAGGGMFRVKAWKEENFYIRKRNCPVWRNGAWVKCEGEGNNAIGLIESCSLDLIGIEESTSHIARNRACAIAMEIFEKNPDIVEKVKSFPHLLQPKEVKDREEKVNDEEADKVSS